MNTARRTSEHVSPARICVSAPRPNAVGARHQFLSRRIAAPRPAQLRAISSTALLIWARMTGLRAVVIGVVLYALLRPALGLGHELTVIGFALGLHRLMQAGFWQLFISGMGLDPVYSGAALRSVGDVQVAGLAVAGPIGEWLHRLLPQLVLDQDRVAPGSGVSMVAVAGASVMGRGLAAFGADVVWITLGLWLLRQWRHRNVTLALVGLMIQGQIVVNHLLDAHITMSALESTGVPFALSVALPGTWLWCSSALNSLPDVWRRIVLTGGLVLIGYACAGLVLAGVVGLQRMTRRRHTIPVQSGRARDMLRLRLAAAAMSLVTAASPVGALALGDSNWVGPAQAQTLSTQPLTPAAAARVTELTRVDSRTGPTRVQIVETRNGSWQYLVNGRAEVIRGVGYNPQYAGLGTAQRSHLYERDFSAMHRLGINTIEGWFETQFDQITLDAAARNGIGVLVPFEINPDWPIQDPSIQQRILDDISAYVERYKDHPAVRMWAPGNENIHRILYPNWRPADRAAALVRADAFSAFLPRVADRIHQLHPNHPVIYRDAEDVNRPPVKAAFQATGVDRPWLVYGANVYSPVRLQQIISAWPQAWIDGPLVISEFAPSGVGAVDRAAGIQQDWSIIRSRPGVVLGGLAYTWATNGPEQVDRIFGLVDQNGIPTDGGLEALSASYLADLMQTASTPSKLLDQ